MSAAIIDHLEKNVCTANVVNIQCTSSVGPVSRERSKLMVFDYYNKEEMLRQESTRQIEIQIHMIKRKLIS
jgi:hypothetical protein